MHRASLTWPNIALEPTPNSVRCASAVGAAERVRSVPQQRQVNQMKSGMEEVSMNVTLRPGNVEDAQYWGAICYEAFKTISEQHNFPPDFPSPEVAIELLAGLLSHPGFYAVVAEREGTIVGSNFLDERSPIAGIGPITVDPAVQNDGRPAAHAGCPRSRRRTPLRWRSPAAGGLPQPLA